ncbi:MAG: hypothetical protein J6X18_11630 [Bacteroidales bacterium]|nr:hypothetical protein [Bacteroidales bacterium]
MSFILKYLKGLRLWDIVIYLLTVLFLVCIIMMFSSRNKSLSTQLETANSNNAAYQMRLESQQAKIIQFELTVDYLRHCNDSVSVKLVEAIDRAEIAEKKLKQANYLKSQYKKTDTLFVWDTIFKEPNFSLDTTVGDKWVQTRLEMSYPNTIVVTPTVVSEKEVLVYNSREIIGEPSRWFFIRWFQKKHTVTRVEVNEENPHIVSQENVFIKTSND